MSIRLGATKEREQGDETHRCFSRTLDLAIADSSICASSTRSLSTPSASCSSFSSSSSSPFFFRTPPNPSMSSSSDSTAWSSTNSERFFALALSPSRCTADLAPSMSSENAVRPCIIIAGAAGAAPPFVFAWEGEGEGDNDCPRGYAYRLPDPVTGASGLVCARRRRRSGSRPTDDWGDVSASVLSGWRAASGLDAAVPSAPSDCVRRSASYGRCCWDGDGLYTRGLELPSGRVCVRNLCAATTTVPSAASARRSGGTERRRREKTRTRSR